MSIILLIKCLLRDGDFTCDPANKTWPYLGLRCYVFFFFFLTFTIKNEGKLKGIEVDVK